MTYLHDAPTYAHCNLHKSILMYMYARVLIHVIGSLIVPFVFVISSKLTIIVLSSELNIYITVVDLLVIDECRKIVCSCL